MKQLNIILNERQLKTLRNLVHKDMRETKWNNKDEQSSDEIGKNLEHLLHLNEIEGEINIVLGN